MSHYPLADGVLKGLRPYTQEDLPQLRNLVERARCWPPSAAPTEEDMQTRWRRRGVVPQADINVLPGSNGELVAFSQSARHSHGVPRLGFEIAVSPDYRCGGIGGALCDLVEARARAMAISHITSPVYVAPGEVRLECAGFLERRGFRIESSYWQMRVDNLAVAPPPRWPEGIVCRRFGTHERDAERWAKLIRECFNEQATAEGIAAQLSEEGVSPEGYFFAVDSRTGVEVGTSRSRIDRVSGEQLGYIGTVGVLPAYRGRGIAQSLIRQTLRYLGGCGVSSATLFVENQNTAARKLYDKMGWRQVYRTDHYWKRLPQTVNTL